MPVLFLSSYRKVILNHAISKHISLGFFLQLRSCNCKVKIDHHSKFSNLSNWKEEAWKKSGLQRDSNPWPPRYWCDALPTELWSYTLGARSIYWVHIFPCSELMWNIYEIIHICTAMCNCFTYYYMYMLWSQDHSFYVESCGPVNHPSFNYNVYSNVLFREWYWKVLFGLLFCWILSTSSSTLLLLTLSFCCGRTVSDLRQLKRKVHGKVIASIILVKG